MPITIVQPPQYANGYPIRNTRGQYAYINTAAKSGIDGELKILREVPRFTGWTQEYYANTGEFEVVIDGADVIASDIKAGNLVVIDGKYYEIEAYSLELTETGYQWTLSGRDLGGRLDRWIEPFSTYSNQNYPTNINDARWRIESIQAQMAFSFYFSSENGGIYTGYGACGWFRDKLNSVRTDFENASTASKTVAATPIDNVLSFGAETRAICNLFKIGYRYDTPEDIVLYDRADKGVTFKSTSKGISNYSYTYDERTKVNTVGLYANYGGRLVALWRSQVNTDASLVNSVQRGDAVRMAAKDLGDVPDESAGSYDAARNWLKAQPVDQEYVPAEESVSFSYDNSGQYKYGVDFFLGSPVTITDDYAGTSTKQTLTGVRTIYGATGALEYGFDFGSQRITHNDVLKRKLNELDYKAALGRTYNEQ